MGVGQGADDNTGSQQQQRHRTWCAHNIQHNIQPLFQEPTKIKIDILTEHKTVNLSITMPIKVTSDPY